MKTFLRILASIIGVYVLVVVLLSLLYLKVNPVSTLMLARYATFQSVHRESVSLKNISPNLLRAVIRAEDDQFCKHNGVDWKSMKRAVAKAQKGKESNGASTLSMQVAKNLFLWPARSYARKAIEVPLAMYLELIWPKKRMLEIYLNMAEWGDGIFGVQAASQHYFKKSARNLSAYEASLLAASLPNPTARNPARPSRYHANYAATIAARMNGGADLSCLK